MRREETGFAYNVKYLPDEVMSHKEYCRRRDEAIVQLVGDRLASKGRMRLVKKHDATMLGMGIPPHQRDEIMLRQFERYAADNFSGQFSSECNTCRHCKVEVEIAHDHTSPGINMIAECYCEAMKRPGLECFDGYVPATVQWRWQDDLVPIEVSFDITAEGDKVVAEMAIVHDDPRFQGFTDPLSGSRHLHYGGNLHDEPQGLMARNNVDSSYLTREELKMANEALARTAKKYRATQPTPQPATPMDDAW